jgi:putative transposase
MANVLDELPKSPQGKVKAGLHEVWMAEPQTRAKGLRPFPADLGTKYSKVVEKLIKDQAALSAFLPLPPQSLG